MPASEDFVRLIDPFRNELLAHCYRMLGSVHDAEDQVQETFIRAWRSYGDFEGRASLRTWLYRIATNACLRELENSTRRPLPSGLGGPTQNPEAPLAVARPEVPWLQPMPDARLGAESADPAAIVVSRQNMRLALIAALQYLPPRQRAVLILRDVLRWRAAEVAELLGTTTTAVNGVLGRARTRLEQVAPAEDAVQEPAELDDRALLDRYAAAFENSDITALMQLLTDDAVFEMPPVPTWFTGRELIGRFLGSRVLGEPGDFRMIPTAANGQPALAGYLRSHDGVHRAHAIQVLTITASRVARVVSFNDPDLFASFGLPQALPAAAMSQRPPSRCISSTVGTRPAFRTDPVLTSVVGSDVFSYAPCFDWGNGMTFESSAGQPPDSRPRRVRRRAAERCSPARPGW
jgi:RNA polymerase sigma-70 factor, ECF subfamily